MNNRRQSGLLMAAFAVTTLGACSQLQQRDAAIDPYLIRIRELEQRLASLEQQKTAVARASENSQDFALVEQLRQQANLPVVMKPVGLNGSLAEDQRLSKFLSKQANILHVPEQEKLAILRHLLGHDTLRDIHVEPANLEQVYQYYLSLEVKDASTVASTGEQH